MQNIFLQNQKKHGLQIIDHYFYPEMSEKANEIKDIGPVESIDLKPLADISKTDSFDVRGLKHSVLL